MHLSTDEQRWLQNLPGVFFFLQVPDAGSGVLVVRVDPLSDAAGAVQENDVLLEVEGFEVADDGTVEFREDERLE